MDTKGLKTFLHSCHTLTVATLYEMWHFVTKRIFLQLRGVYVIHVVDEIVHYQLR